MIIRPFNAGFFLLVAIMIGAIVLLWALLHGQPERWRAAVLITLCMVNIIGFLFTSGFCPGMRSFFRYPGSINSTGSMNCRCSFVISICF